MDEALAVTCTLLTQHTVVPDVLGMQLIVPAKSTRQIECKVKMQRS